MDKPIQLSALGRPVNVGDLYNYYNGSISSRSTGDDPLPRLQVKTNESNQITPKIHYYPHHQLKDYKKIFLNINSHLNRNINNGSILLEGIWFAKFLSPHAVGKEERLPQVSILLQFISRIDTILEDVNQFSTKQWLGSKNDTAVTHLVEKVSYGIELLLTIRKKIDRINSCQKVEEQLRLTAKSIFDQGFPPAGLGIEIPTFMEETNCTLYGNLLPDEPLSGSFKNLYHFMIDALCKTSKENHRPIEITLRYLPILNMHLEFDSREDFETTKKMQMMIKQNIIAKINEFVTLPWLDRAKLFKEALEKILDVFHILFGKIDESQKTVSEVGKLHRETTDLLIQIDDWINARLQREIDIICFLLNVEALTIHYYKDMRSNVSPVCQNTEVAYVFLLKVTLVEDALINDIQTKIDDTRLPIKFPRITTEIKRNYHIHDKWSKFTKEAQMKSSIKTAYCVGLVENVEECKEGETEAINYPSAKMLLFDDSMEEEANWNSSSTTEFMNENISFNSSNLVEYHTSKQVPIEDSTFDLGEMDSHERSPSFTSSTNKYLDRETNNLDAATCHDQLKHVYDETTQIGGKREIDKEHPIRKETTEIFANKYSELIIEGKPNIFLLNVEEKMVDQSTRWFTIGSKEEQSSVPSFASKNDHRVIILMGATGSGKSTLINGMVNFILGVKWGDPYRFEVVRKDQSSVGRSQAFSQTSSVTAYTIYHQNGMAIPYSITIIDTPGYGDTYGIKSDREITDSIHRFLTHSEAVDRIHAACFVAASGDSRLTATQRYVIDSVLSIFGNDFKKNLRLLVTFADNEEPPVVAACKAAHFPAPSGSDSITYSKFNSSVLYASNQPSTDDDFCFDELFWDMGQENFCKFFAMLGRMEGRDMKSTREVIELRKSTKETLQDLEDKIEICLIKIEESEILRSKLNQLKQNMLNSQNFFFEKTELEVLTKPCKSGYVVYNCHRCRITCDNSQMKHASGFKVDSPTCGNFSCYCPPSVHRYEGYLLIHQFVKRQHTFQDLKNQYEMNYRQKWNTDGHLSNTQLELDVAKAEAVSLLYQLSENAKTLDSKALRSNALSPNDYLSLMKSQVMEEQRPGYLTRLQTLNELQSTLDVKFSSATRVHPLLDSDYGAYAADYRPESRENELADNTKKETKGSIFQRAWNAWF